MFKIDMLYGGWIKAPNGASSVVRTLFEGRQIFEDNSAELNLFSLDKITEREFKLSSEATPPKSKPKYLIKELVRKLSKNNPFFAWLEFYFEILRHARHVVSDYVKKTDTNNSILVHGFFTGYELIKHTKFKNRKIAVVIHTNGSTFNMLKIKYPCIVNSWVMDMLNKMEKQLIDSNCAIGFVSESSMIRFKEEHPNISNHLFYIYNGIPDIAECADTSVTLPKYRLCTVGTVSERKGQFRIVKALSMLDKNQLTDYHLTIVGDGEDIPAISQFIKEKQLEDYVALVGSQKNVIPYLKDSNVFILPSKDEGLPISIMEAMRQGLPIISTRVGGIPEMIEDNQSGLLINPDVNSILSALLKIQDIDLQDASRKSRRIYEDKFRIEDMVRKYVQIMKD